MFLEALKEPVHQFVNCLESAQALAVEVVVVVNVLLCLLGEFGDPVHAGWLSSELAAAIT
jgi:hypothetical protein